jgi:CRP-like cAMP-binding protein
VHVKQMGFASVLVFGWIASLAIAPTSSGGESPTSCDGLLSALRQVPIFQRLDQKGLQQVASVAEVVERQGGDRIIEQGQRTGKMAIAIDSEVAIRIDGETLRVLPANSLVGEMEFLEEVPASADVLLVGKSRVILLEHKRFRSLMDADPGLGYALMDEIARMEASRLRTNTQRQAK